MHELALCQGLVDLIEDQRARDPFEQVHRVVLEIGAWAHVDGDALRFAFDVAARGTVAETAELELVELPAEAWCMRCCETVTVRRRGDSCPKCSSDQLIHQQADELKLKALEVQ